MSLVGLLSYNSDTESDAEDDVLNSVCKADENFLEPLTESIDRGEIAPSYQDEDGNANVTSITTDFLDDIPARPHGEPNVDTVKKIIHYFEMRDANGFDLTKHIRTSKDFGNPQILQKCVEHFHIDEISSNYPANVFNPHGYSSEDFVDGIQAVRRSTTTTSTKTTTETSIITASNGSTLTTGMDNRFGGAVAVAAALPLMQRSHNSSSNLVSSSSLITTTFTTNATITATSSTSNTTTTGIEETYISRKRQSRWGVTSMEGFPTAKK